MRSYEFLAEDDLSSIEGNVIAALNLLAGRIKQGEMSDQLPVNMVIRYIRNTGISNFNIENLVDISEKNESLKNIIKSVSKDKITFKTDNISSDKNDSDTSSEADDDQQDKDTVSKMAKSALKRRS
jgi:hypothetical protein